MGWEAVAYVQGLAAQRPLQSHVRDFSDPSPPEGEPFGGLSFCLRGKGMKNLRPIVALALALVVGPVSAHAEASALTPKTTAGGLTCFSVSLGYKHDTNDPAPSCRVLCAAEGAACTGVTSNLSPALTCESEAEGQSCRCCTVQK